MRDMKDQSVQCITITNLVKKDAWDLYKGIVHPGLPLKVIQCNLHERPKCTDSITNKH